MTMPASVMHEDEIAHSWKDLLAPAASIENAVMSNPFLKVIRLLLRRNVSAQLVRRMRLAGSRDVVQFALNREQRRVSDRGWIDCLALPCHSSARQRVPLENPGDGLQEKLGRHVHDGEVFVIEFTVLVGTVAIPAHQVLEQLHVSVHVPVKVHRHETAQLDEAWINLAEAAGII